MIGSDNDDIFKGLTKFNLSNYAIRVYKCLLLNGPMPATDVVKETGIPQPRVYDIFSLLEKKGLVSVSSGLRKIYMAVPPKEAFSKEIDEMQRYIKNLDDYIIKNRKKDETVEPSLWLIKSKTKLKTTILDSIKNAETEIIISASYENLKSLSSYIREAAKNGVTVSIVIFNDSPSAFIDMLSKYSVIRVRDAPPAEMMLVDRSRAIVDVGSMLQNADYSIMLDEDELIHMLTYYFFYTIWSPSRYIYDFTRMTSIKLTTSWLACEAIENLKESGFKIMADLKGILENRPVELKGEIIGTKRVMGVRQSFIIKVNDEEFSVGGKNAKLEDIKMQSVVIYPKSQS
ncbi:TrmB family transcriptional regulator [Picrophilus oshimae]|uniref:Transcriptional regulator n=1 Tax=Picrophilus torridus (strain ATCC 700027 / DSM 9790 / JCM 10055 / NBRC 100828 / KAW 2/3) TaxID=1122961 RepID=Q6KZ13_PICTO|nr:TrmB family transcriptional regulator [Picrophilus oshimae]AAT44039.1 transcriptional regulator [Picrophilus oshimae DSM 9789]